MRESISLLCLPQFLSEACSTSVGIILQIEHRSARLSQAPVRCCCAAFNADVSTKSEIWLGREAIA